MLAAFGLGGRGHSALIFKVKIKGRLQRILRRSQGLGLGIALGDGLWNIDKGHSETTASFIRGQGDRIDKHGVLLILIQVVF